MNLPPPTHDDVVDYRRGRLAAWFLAVVGAVAAFLGLRGGAQHPLPTDDLAELARAVASDAQDYWTERMPDYRRADVVVYAGGIWSPCGEQRGWQGPAYCPRSGTVYIDLAFLRPIAGDGARAYVVAHELGHHVQRLAGSPAAGIARELQADCLAGAWLGDALRRGAIVDRDVDAVAQEAAAVGDDVLAPGSVPVLTGHGTGAQRAASVRIGVVGGPAACGAR